MLSAQVNDPAFRGAMCHGVLAAIEALPRGRDILTKVDPATLETVRRASKLAWVPYAVLAPVHEAVFVSVGADRYVDFWRAYSVGAVESSLFAALFEGALRIFGRRPGGLLRWLGRSWEVSTRGLGHVECQIAEDHAAVIVTGVASTARRESTMLATKGAVLAVLELTHHRGEAEIDGAGLPDGAYTIHTRWIARPIADEDE